MSGGADVGKVCRNADSGRICFCSRTGDDAGKVTFKVKTFDMFVRCKPFEWTCDMFHVTHAIYWTAEPVAANGARVGVKAASDSASGSMLFHAAVSSLVPSSEYKIAIVGHTGCTSAQDPDTVCAIAAEYCGEEIYRAEGLVLHPRGHKFVVTFTTDDNADVSGVDVTLAARDDA